MSRDLPSRAWIRKVLDRCQQLKADRECDTASWKRQWMTARAILRRLHDHRGQLLADDAGMGKTMAALIVALAFINAGKSVVILAPNPAVRESWLRQYHLLARWLGMPERSSDKEIGADAASDALRRSVPGRIRLGTHGRRGGSLECDLLIVDEAHRSKGEGTDFRSFLNSVAERRSVRRFLYVTATPMSIGIAELTGMLRLCGAGEEHCAAVEAFADCLDALWLRQSQAGPLRELERIVDSRRKAIRALRLFVVRHTIAEQTQLAVTYGAVRPAPQQAVTADDPSAARAIVLADRALRLSKQLCRASGERTRHQTNDPRFHVGNRMLDMEMTATMRKARRGQRQASSDGIRVGWKFVGNRAAAAKSAISKVHPKVSAVANRIADIVAAGHKVLVFAHHHATACEIGSAIARACSTVLGSKPLGVAQHRRMLQALRITDQRQKGDPLLGTLAAAALKGGSGVWLQHCLFDMADVDRAGLWGSRSSPATQLDSFSWRLQRQIRENPRGSLARSVYRRKRPYMKGMPVGWVMLLAHDKHGARPQADPGVWLHDGRPDLAMAWFNSPFGPPVMVATDRLSEGVDLHTHCRHLVHYEIHPSPVRMIQRLGRLRRIGSLASRVAKLTEEAEVSTICEYAPYFVGTRDEVAVRILGTRLQRFDHLLGGVGERIDAEQDTASEIATVLDDLPPVRHALAVHRPATR